MRRFIPVFFVLLLTACGSDVSQNLKINIGAQPQSLDPRLARDLASQTLAKMFFEGLTRINLQDQSELALAQRVEVSEDGKTYTFHLLKAKWSSGDPVTAYDFAHAWRRVLHPQFPSNQAFQLYVIKNGKAAKEEIVSVEEIGVQA